MNNAVEQLTRGLAILGTACTVALPDTSPPGRSQVSLFPDGTPHQTTEIYYGPDCPKNILVQFDEKGRLIFSFNLVLNPESNDTESGQCVITVTDKGVPRSQDEYPTSPVAEIPPDTKIKPPKANSSALPE